MNKTKQLLKTVCEEESFLILVKNAKDVKEVIKIANKQGIIIDKNTATIIFLTINN